MLRDADGPDPAPWRRRPPCPARTTRRTPPPPPRWPLALGLAAATRSPRGSAASPACRTGSSAWPMIDGVAWVNDSKATNADAAARALACYDRIVWIAGGQAKAGGIESLAPVVPPHRPRAADRPRRAAAGRHAARGRRAAQPSGHAGRGGGGSARARRRGSAPRWSCCPRPAPASTSSPGFEARGDRFAELARAAAIREPA